MNSSKHITNYSWYKISIPSTAVGEKYDPLKDIDILTVLEKEKDVSFFIFGTHKEKLGIWLRLVKESTTLESIQSFQHELQEKPPFTHVDAFVELKMTKQYVYPLNTDASPSSDIFTLFSYEKPYGVFGIKLKHAQTNTIQRKYKSLLSQKLKDDVKKHDYNPLLKSAKAKSETAMFFYSQIFFAVKDKKDVSNFMRRIPKTLDDAGRYNQNHLVKSRTVKSDKKRDSATKKLKEFVVGKAKKTNLVLSKEDVSLFVCFPKKQNIGLASSVTPTMSNDYFDEVEFKRQIEFVPDD